MHRKSRKCVLFLLAAAALALDGRGFAQQSSGSPDGLYVVPDADQSTHDGQDSPSRREAENYMNSLDPQFQRSKPASEPTSAAVRKLDGAGVNSGPARPAVGPDVSEHAGIWISFSVGLLVSLAAAGFFWRARARLRKARAAALISLERKPSAGHAAAIAPDKTFPRRAA